MGEREREWEGGKEWMNMCSECSTVSSFECLFKHFRHFS